MRVRSLHESACFQWANVARSERVSASRLVRYRDLDIDSPSGARELHYRIERAARDACQELDDRYPNAMSDNGDCVGDAVRNAEHDVGSYDDRDGW